MTRVELADFSAYDLRSGFVAQAGRNRSALVDAMRKPVQQAASYRDEQERAQSVSGNIDPLRSTNRWMGMSSQLGTSAASISR
jgi:hypothetical protein